MLDMAQFVVSNCWPRLLERCRCYIHQEMLIAFFCTTLARIDNWMVVWNIFYFYPYLGKISNLTNIFQMGWNHQPDNRWLEVFNFLIDNALKFPSTICANYDNLSRGHLKWWFSIRFIPPKWPKNSGLGNIPKFAPELWYFFLYQPVPFPKHTYT